MATLTSLPTSKVLTIVTFGIPAVFHSSNARPRGDSLGSISFFIAVVLPQRYKKTATQAFAQIADCSFGIMYLVLLFQSVILFVGDRLQPLSFTRLLSRLGRVDASITLLSLLHQFVAVAGLGIGMVGEVLHPAVFGGTVPMLHALGNGDDGARHQWNGFLAPFLIPATTAHADQHLHGTVVDVPVVAAARLEADIAEATCGIEDGEIAVANEILGVCGVGFSDGPRRVES